MGCLKWIQMWCDYWEKDLSLRPKEVIKSARGQHAYDDFKAAMKAFQFLFNQLKSRTLANDLRKGIWLMIQAMKERNYLYANSILLNAIAIGNSPWPIGVTQVGIHTKSAAREKISTSHLNKNAAAHVMGDEATRKYLHALKRLLTSIQRLFPTDPSRSIEFHEGNDTAIGVQGSGNVKLALLEAEKNGDIARPAPIRSLLQYNMNNKVKVPDRLRQILKYLY